MQSAARQANIYPTGYVNYGGARWGRYGWYGGSAYWQNVRGERRAVRTEERTKGATNATNIMTDVENATAKIRRTMTERYQIEF